MMREMGGGRNAYVLHEGQKTRRDDVVDIFAAHKSDKIATVSEQTEFYKNWLKSIGIGTRPNL
jgi:hypothetical protein